MHARAEPSTCRGFESHWARSNPPYCSGIYPIPLLKKSVRRLFHCSVNLIIYTAEKVVCNFFIALIMLVASHSATSVFRLLLCPASITTRQASAFSSSTRRNRLARPPSGADGMSALSTRGDSVTSKRQSLFAPGCARTENTVAIALSPKLRLRAKARYGTYSIEKICLLKPAWPVVQRHIAAPGAKLRAGK